MDDPALAARLGAVVRRTVPGVAILIVDADGVRAQAASGLADLASGRVASASMICPWFSMTKLVTVTAALRLAHDGTLDVDEPVIRHVPELGLLEPSPAAGRITARHLMSHGSGIANPMPVRWIHKPDAPGVDLGEFVARLLRNHARLRFEPGARASYSNVGTLVLGLAMQRAAAVDFNALILQQVLEPLRLHETAFTFGAASRAATGYHGRWNPLRLLLPSWVVGKPQGRWISLRPFLLDGAPYGGLVGPPADAARFLQMHLRDGELEGVRVLPATLSQAMRVVRPTSGRLEFGLGWFRTAKARSAEPPYLEHWGGGAGFFNAIRIYPTRGVGAIVMGNATSFDIEAVAALAVE